MATWINSLVQPIGIGHLVLTLQPCVDIATFKMSTATISQGLQAITGCKGAGLFLGALAIWHFAQCPQ